jgi:superfamily II DNA or RNA helicase/intein/homing endonuclease
VIKLYESATHIVIESKPAVLDRLVQHFAFKPDGYWYALSYERYVASKGKEGWDGFIRPIQRLGDTGAKAMRGRKMDIIEWAEETGYDVDMSKTLTLPFTHLTVDDIRPDLIAGEYELDSNQRRCVFQWLRHAIGINQVTVSGGKCLGKGTPVMMCDGSTKPVEDIVVGDLLMGPDSRPRWVLALGRGRAELYRVAQANGDTYVCNGDHLMALYHFKVRGNYYKRRTSTLEHLVVSVDDYLKLSKNVKKNCTGYKVGICLKEQKTILEPYLLGLWLGDGHRHKPSITTGDPEIKEFVTDAARKMGLKITVEKGQGCENLYMSTGKRSPGGNAMVTALKKLKLWKAPHKFIPDSYLRNSRRVRLLLLAGLIDTDGSVKRNGQFEITSVYKVLAENIVWLARSLGYSASFKPKITTCQTGAVGLAYRVRITGALSEVPVRVAHKKTGDCLMGGLRTRIRVQAIGEGDYYGFELNNDGFFLLGDFTVTHNTAMFAGAGAFIKEHYPDAKLLYLTPSERLVRQSTKEMKRMLPHYEVGQYGGGKNEPDAEIVVCTVAMLNRHFHDLKCKGWFNRFMGVFFDECFVAGTLVGSVPIENLRIGDTVTAFDEAAWCITKKKVTRLFKSRPEALVKITLSSCKQIVCTLNHPFLTLAGWKPAFSLTKSDMVLTVSHGSNRVQSLWKNVRGGSLACSGEQSVLFKRVRSSVPPENQLGNDGQNKSKVCFKTNEGEESNDQSCLERKSITDIAAHALETTCAGWKGASDAGGTEKTSFSSSTTDRTCRSYGLLERSTWFSDSLYAGYCGTESKVRHRSGRRFPPVSVCQAEGLQTHEILGEQRVDSVEILQPTSDGEFGGMCPDGFVYNIEVEDCHTYTAGGCIVHNCHHSASESSQKVLLSIPAFFRFGASDTVKEDDERKWNDIRGLFGSVLNVVKAAPLIVEGRIAKPHIYIVDHKEWNNKFEDVSYSPPAKSPAHVLVDDEWKSGRYISPVYERDDKGNIVHKEVKTAIKDDQDQWIIEQVPVTVPGLHLIEMEGVEHEIVSKWCLLRRTYDQAIIQFNDRNKEIVRWAKHFSDRGLTTVVVCTRTLHVYILEAMLAEVINPDLVDILVGKDTSVARDACFEWLKQTPGAVLITPLIKEGVSLNCLRAGVIADYCADFEVANQLVGRFIRQKKKGTDNSAEIVWFRDRQHPSLRRGCNSVFRALEQIEGYTFYDPAPEPESLLLAARQGELNLA